MVNYTLSHKVTSKTTTRKLITSSACVIYVQSDCASEVLWFKRGDHKYVFMTML